MPKYPSQVNVKTVRLTPEVHTDLKALAIKWQMTLGDTIKMLVQFAEEGELRPQIVLRKDSKNNDTRKDS
jgi:hypothetical protein